MTTTVDTVVAPITLEIPLTSQNGRYFSFNTSDPTGFQVPPGIDHLIEDFEQFKVRRDPLVRNPMMFVCWLVTKDPMTYEEVSRMLGRGAMRIQPIRVLALRDLDKPTFEYVKNLMALRCETSTTQTIQKLRSEMEKPRSRFNTQ